MLDNLVAVGQWFVIASAAAVALLGFLFLMPRTGYELSQSLGSLSEPAWSISRSTTPGVLRLSGEFQHGVSDAVAIALARDPSIHLLELDSPGGDSDQGLELGALVEKYSLSTFVRHRCASACTFVFVAGRERVLMPGAKLGFHRARSVMWDDQITDDDKYNEHVTAYLEAKGIMASFAQKVFRVSNDDIWYPSIDELLGAGVISRKPME
jgi:membrane-bound ClpP family serine protease